MSLCIKLFFVLIIAMFASTSTSFATDEEFMRKTTQFFKKGCEIINDDDKLMQLVDKKNVEIFSDCYIAKNAMEYRYGPAPSVLKGNFKNKKDLNYSYDLFCHTWYKVLDKMNPTRVAKLLYIITLNTADMKLQETAIPTATGVLFHEINTPKLGPVTIMNLDLSTAYKDRQADWANIIWNTYKGGHYDVLNIIDSLPEDEIKRSKNYCKDNVKLL